ncbi:T3SS (YopN, CesT) and YbjN peptide-binding chaperone 1 [Microbacterium aurum]
MADVAGVSNKIQTILQERNLVYSVREAGHYSLRFDSIEVFVRVWSHSDDSDALTYINFEVPLLVGVADSPELYKHIALHADDYTFGHLSLRKFDDGRLAIFFTHVLLGDYLDAAEFHATMGTIVGTGNKLDEELQTQFGGKRWHEDD